LSRTSADPAFSRSSRGAHFLQGCRATAAQTPGFCASVPDWSADMKPDEEAESDLWQKAQCATISSTDWTCLAQLKFVQLHCHPR
jgi:hypothetical protein